MRRTVVLFCAVGLLSLGCADSKPVLEPYTAKARLTEDPNPSAPGFWVANDPYSGQFSREETPQTCYKDVNPNIVDTDEDWLDQECEYKLANAFAPIQQNSHLEECSGGEPVWAAKYFPNAQRVRIAYMLAYYQDCGAWGTGHLGDSEMVMVEVGYNSVTMHWEVIQLWLSAHYQGEFLGVSGDNSRFLNWDLAEYPTSGFFSYNRSRGRPRVWVSRNKHANYRSQQECNSFQDVCTAPPQVVAYYTFMRPERNAGSRHVDLIGCPTLYSMWDNAGSGRAECFYTSRRFNGWYASGSGVSPYRDVLMSNKFEKMGEDWGPGAVPIPPAVVNVNGPTTIRNEGGYTWNATASGGDGTYEYTWEESVEGSAYVIVGDGNTFSKYIDTNSGLYIDLRVTVKSGPITGGRVKRVNVLIPE